MTQGVLPSDSDWLWSKICASPARWKWRVPDRCYPWFIWLFLWIQL